MKNKKWMSIMILSLVAVFAAGVTLAYFTDTSGPVTNTFTMGNVEILLDEADVDAVADDFGGFTWEANEEADRVYGNTYTNIYPGAFLPKDPTVTNTGSNPAFVRVMITVENFGSEDVAPSSLWLATLGAGWVLDDVASGAGVYVYNYTDVLAPGLLTTPVFTSLTIPASFNSAQMASIGDFNLVIEAHAIQAQGFADVAAAFAAYGAQP